MSNLISKRRFYNKNSKGKQMLMNRFKTDIKNGLINCFKLIHQISTSINLTAQQNVPLDLSVFSFTQSSTRRQMLPSSGPLLNYNLTQPWEVHIQISKICLHISPSLFHSQNDERSEKSVKNTNPSNNRINILCNNYTMIISDNVISTFLQN